MNIALILAGGTGTRLGSDIPKQYIKIEGKAIIAYCVEVFENHKGVDCIQIVANDMWRDFILENIQTDKFKGFSDPGKTRQLSIFNGLCDIKEYADDDDCVIIHDAARPLVSEEMINDCFEKLHSYDGVLPVLPMKDTVYMSDDGKSITSLMDRSKIFAGQAPEAFKIGKYYDSNKVLFPDRILKINGSTEPAVMAGLDIAVIDGDENNFKITTKNDLERFKEIVKQVRK